VELRGLRRSGSATGANSGSIDFDIGDAPLTVASGVRAPGSAGWNVGVAAGEEKPGGADVGEEVGRRSIVGEQTSRSMGAISRKREPVFLLDSMSEGSTDNGELGEAGVSAHRANSDGQCWETGRAHPHAPAGRRGSQLKRASSSYLRTPGLESGGGHTQGQTLKYEFKIFEKKGLRVARSTFIHTQNYLLCL
jgi:hypothetical protein